MNVKHEVTPTYLVIIPPVGAILNEGLIIEKVQRRMNTDNVFFSNPESLVRVSEDEELILWVHKDAPRYLSPEIATIVKRFPVVTMMCMCPECDSFVLKNEPTNNLMPAMSAHWYCEDCGERSLP